MVEEEKDGQAQTQEETTNLVVPWMRAPVDVSHVDSCSLETLPSLHPRLKEALEKMGISSLFPVQVAVWHETIGPGGFERDVCVNSPTGSGKTLSYALPIVQTLSSRAVRCLRALVVLPTRDLALQVKGVFDAIAPSVGLSVGSAVGQSSIAGDIAQLIKTPKLDAGICYDPEDISQNLESSAVDILVATPGRLMDHINNTKGFTLEHLRYLICETGVKPVYLVGLLKSLEGEKCIVFTSSVETTRRLCKLLNFFGDSMIKAKEYSGGLNQAVRSKELKAFRKGDIQVLISSDALARGMDVELVTNVINYDMPQYPKTFIHRAGRTARAGRAGRCFTLLGDHEVRRFSNLLKKVGNASCPIYPIPPDLFGPVRAIYEPALAKLKESVEPIAPKRGRQVRRFSNLLKKVGNASCPIYPIPPDLFVPVRAIYEPALAKLKESVEPIAPKRGRQVGFKHNSRTTNSQTKRNKATSEQA
ncbi:hypothetical protein F2Q68_00030579 [Brassica cretica]|uniref:RNA helicase n=1 Tax=Brassica cretica TaxID=69181 RepID=A0A8S9GD12_BRACR|nr:hypothetical protein F2Q68_00030579 [Brassica cretica]